MRFLLLFLAKHHKHSGSPDVPSARPDTSCCSGDSGELFRLAGFHLFHPIRICDELAAHGGALDASAGELLLHKIRVVQTTDTTDGQIGVLPHLIAEFEEASRLAEIGMIGGRDGVFQCGMVCQRYMEAGHIWKLLTKMNG